MAKIMIDIKCRIDGKKWQKVKLEAVRLGKYFALHHPCHKPGEDPSGAWVLTHVPTGLAISMFDEKDRELALDLAVELQRQVDLDWSFTNKAVARSEPFKIVPVIIRRVRSGGIKPIEPSDAMDMMKVQAAANLIKWSAGYVMWCQACKSLLDRKTTVVISSEKHGSCVICADCYDGGKHSLGKFGKDVEVDDGRRYVNFF